MVGLLHVFAHGWTSVLRHVVFFGLCATVGCATRYSLTPIEQGTLPARIALPDGAADRLIVRLDNPGENWLSLNWEEARIVGLTGFAVPVRMKPSTPISSLPPRSSVEYHLFPAHYYQPEARYKQRRESVEFLLVYDTDFENIVANGVDPVLELFLPMCADSKDACCVKCDNASTKWEMGHTKVKIARATP
jgi:hypothetical protein